MVQALYPTAAFASGIPKSPFNAAIIANQNETLNSPITKRNGSILTLYAAWVVIDNLLWSAFCAVALPGW